jgi:acyl carrier protein
MTRVEQRARRIVGEHVSLTEGGLTVETKLPEDPHIFARIVIALQREFGVDLPEGDLDGISTVDDLIKSVESAVAAKH